MSDFVSFYFYFFGLCATTPTQLLLTLCCWSVVSLLTDAEIGPTEGGMRPMAEPGLGFLAGGDSGVRSVNFWVTCTRRQRK